MAKKPAGGFTPSQPDYDVTAIAGDGSHKGRVGAAWTQPDGSIAIKLSPFVTLDASAGVKIRLWPIEYDDNGKRKAFAPKDDDNEGGGDPLPY